LLRNPSLANAMRDAGRKKMQSEFIVKNMVRQMGEIYQYHLSRKL
jgi:hypothetical protein